MAKGTLMRIDLRTINSLCKTGARLAMAAAFAGIWACSTMSAASAGVLERIAETGQLTAGTRADARPFAMMRPDGVIEGFSIDLLEIIREELEETLGRPVDLQLEVVTAADRLDRIESGELDIVCGITTPTWEREEQVDFTIPFFRDGTRVLSYRETVESGIGIDYMRIGVVAGTITRDIVADDLPTSEIQTFSDMESAMAAMEAGEVDGIANIGVVLLGMAQRAEPRRSVVLLPRTAPLGTEALACVVPEDDSAWRDMVNRTLVSLYQGIGDYRGRYVEVYERWFGRNGALVYPLDRSTRDYLGEVNIWAQ